MPSTGRQSVDTFASNTPRTPVVTSRYRGSPTEGGDTNGDEVMSSRGGGTAQMPMLPAEYRSSNCAVASVFPDADDDRELFDTFSFM